MHPESLLLTMITDERKHIRELGLRRVIKARQTNPDEQTIRAFNAPTINIEAKDYIEIIDC